MLLAWRAVIVLLVPACASLTLDGDGFEIGQLFGRKRSAWRDVSEFLVEGRHQRGGLVSQAAALVPG